MTTRQCIRFLWEEFRKIEATVFSVLNCFVDNTFIECFDVIGHFDKILKNFLGENCVLKVKRSPILLVEHKNRSGVIISQSLASVKVIIYAIEIVTITFLPGNFLIQMLEILA